MKEKYKKGNPFQNSFGGYEKKAKDLGCFGGKLLGTGGCKIEMKKEKKR